MRFQNNVFHRSVFLLNLVLGCARSCELFPLISSFLVKCCIINFMHISFPYSEIIVFKKRYFISDYRLNLVIILYLTAPENTEFDSPS